MHISVLTVRHAAESFSLTPLFVNRRLLKEAGITFRVYYGDNDHMYDADCVLFDGRVYRKWDGKNRDQEVAAHLDKIRGRVDRLIWFDTTDSTGTTQFQFLPYLDRYLKIQALKDRSRYQRGYYGGRIFTDYYHTDFGVDDSSVLRPLATVSASDLHKIKVAWGHALADYGRWAQHLRRLRKRIPLPAFYSQRFVKPLERTVDASFRFGSSYRRETVAFQRQLVRETASALGYPTEKIARTEYLRELRESKVSVSPFGWGEPSYKDFEVIINGSALLKPDMSHVETWPDLYVAGKTYLPFKWDCSDLREVLDDVLSGDKWRQLATRAQAVYGKYLFEREGAEEFCARFRDLVSF